MPTTSPSGPPLPFEVVIFDLAGTTIDCGCASTVEVFVEIFARRGVRLDADTARGPMGMHKREHLRHLCAQPPIAAAWRAARGTAPTEADLDAMYNEAEPLQIAAFPRHHTPIPGFLATLAELRARGIRVGATTGYTRPMVEVLAPLMAAAGWTPDVLLGASDAPAGRPAPYLNQLVAMQLGATDVRRVVVVGDTVVDMQSARNAGMWGVGVALTGNQVGLGVDALAALPDAERRAARERAGAVLRAAGAHVVIDSVADLIGALGSLA